MTAKAVADYDPQQTGFHNHNLLQGQAALNTNPQNRSIPLRIYQHASLHVESGFSISKTYAALVHACAKEGIELTFTKKDIKNEFSMKAKHKVLDSSNLSCLLLKDRMEKNPSVYFNVDTDGDSTLDRVFFLMEGCPNLWLAMPSTVVLLDTKHGTNCFGLKLGCFVTTDENGKTRVLAACLLHNQDTASFTWLLNEFNKGFGGRSRHNFH